MSKRDHIIERKEVTTIVVPDDGIPYLVTKGGSYPSYDPRYNPGPYITLREAVGLTLLTVMVGSTGVVALRRMIRRLRREARLDH